MSVYFDQSTAIKYSGGSEQVQINLLHSFLEQCEKCSEKLEDFLRRQDWEAYAGTCKKIQDTALTVGALRISTVAEDLEIAARAGDEIMILTDHYPFLKEIQKGNEEARELLSALEAAPEPISVSKGHASSKKHSILVVDDSATNLVIATRLFESSYRVTAVKSASMALKSLERSLPTLILLDIAMPEMDGFELMTILQSREEYRRIPVIFLTADRSAEAEKRCFEAGAVDFIGKPFIPTIMVQRVARQIELEDYRQNLERMVKEQLKFITKLQQDIIVSMANLIESRDGTTGEHIRGTTIYTEYLTKRLMEKNLYPGQIDSSFCDFVCKAAPLHDIGKISVPDVILQKTERLTPSEYEQMKGHAAEGGRLIRKNMSSINDPLFVDTAYDMATYHHEKWDGTGYPKGLKGTEIPLSARILAVTDVFDALISARQYKKALPLEHAIHIMKSERGIRFEPLLLDTFLEDQETLAQLVQEVSHK